ncbi:MAG: zinc ribbon domain-containing protein [Clostridia bacterium]|nr:zinc ribbon domain-containing protein [Clostridia bacterium]
MGKVFCQNCGSVLSESAAFCPACGSANEGGGAKASKPSSQSKMIWIIILSVLFVVSVVAIVLILNSTELHQTTQMYEFLKAATEFEELVGRNPNPYLAEYKQVKSELMSYYISVGVCGVVALASLVGNILLFMKIKKRK